MQLTLASENEREAKETSMEAVSKLSNLETQLKTQKKQLSSLKSDLQMEHNRSQDLEDNLKRYYSIYSLFIVVNMPLDIYPYSILLMTDKNLKLTKYRAICIKTFEIYEMIR